MVKAHSRNRKSCVLARGRSKKYTDVTKRDATHAAPIEMATGMRRMWKRRRCADRCSSREPHVTKPICELPAAATRVVQKKTIRPNIHGTMSVKAQTGTSESTQGSVDPFSQTWHTRTGTCAGSSNTNGSGRSIWPNRDDALSVKTQRHKRKYPVVQLAHKANLPE